MEARIEIVDHRTGKVRPYEDLPIPGVEGSGATDFERDAKWALRITVDEELRLELSGLEGGDIAKWAVLLDYVRDDGRLEEVDPARMAALTEAPMLGQYAVIEDDGGYRVDGKVWAYLHYQVLSPVDELVKYGVVELDFVGDFDNELFPDMDSEDYARLSRDNYENCVPDLSSGPRP